MCQRLICDWLAESHGDHCKPILEQQTFVVSALQVLTTLSNPPPAYLLILSVAVYSSGFMADPYVLLNIQGNKVAEFLLHKIINGDVGNISRLIMKPNSLHAKLLINCCKSCVQSGLPSSAWLKALAQGQILVSLFATFGEWRIIWLGGTLHDFTEKWLLGSTSWVQKISSEGLLVLAIPVWVLLLSAFISVQCCLLNYFSVIAKDRTQYPVHFPSNKVGSFLFSLLILLEANYSWLNGPQFFLSL